LPELRIDPLSGRRVIVAGERGSRPNAFLDVAPAAPVDPDKDPFLEGHEDQTPPEVYALRPNGGPPDSPGWQVRVVPNLYPAFERQEVVIHSPRHVRTFADLADDEITLVAETWLARMASGPSGYVHPLINEGRQAGASLSHSHSQLVWLREPPPAVRDEQPDGLDALHAAARTQSLVVAETETLVAFCHPVGRLPYETLIMAAGTAPFEEALPAALRLLRDVVGRLRQAEGAVPWNAWLHHGAVPWHIELVPRLSVLAGLELGAGVYVNSLPPEQAAAALRG
jgi:UDPglucose--hexose-1-phosphate uridylyltransferase